MTAKIQLRLRQRQPTDNEDDHRGSPVPGANTYTYDGLGRVATWLNPGGTTTTYGYDGASNRTTVTTPAGTRTSTFDQRNRLTGTTGAGQPADTYTWTPRGNPDHRHHQRRRPRRTRSTRSNGSPRPQKTGGYTVTYTYDSLDRPAQRNGAKFGYHDLSNKPILSPAALGEATLLRDPSGEPLCPPRPAPAGALLLGDWLARRRGRHHRPGHRGPRFVRHVRPVGYPGRYPVPSRWATRAADRNPRPVWSTPTRAGTTRPLGTSPAATRGRCRPTRSPKPTGTCTPTRTR